MMPDSRFAALYYPYADVRPSRGLLEACLYFDRVHVLEPNFFRPPGHPGRLSDVPHAAGMAPLVEAGVIEPIGPDLLGFAQGNSREPLLDEDNLALLRASIEADLADPALVRLAADRAPASWRIPTGQQLFWNGLGLLLERPQNQISVLTERVDYYQSYMSSSGYHASQFARPAEDRWRDAADLQVDVPYLEAESLIIGVVLLACAEFGLSPITDARFHQNFLRQKLSRMYEDPELRDAIRPVLPSVREQDIGLHTLQLHLPRLALADAAGVLKLRERCAGSLERFRTHFRQIGLQAAEQPWTPEFQEEVRRIVATEVDPALEELRARLGEAGRGLGIEVITTVPQSAPLSLLATLAPGVSPAVSLAAGAGAAAVTSLAKYLTSRRGMRRHGLYFLLEAQR
ncbi:hypothetical protein M8Z33_27655 [Streptomyces sp. ZAF1911]|uniref:hypothetical protein n=1 Tax=Streptomyces sp. ZAF1911 TaxID=2944129 RepID=UPI00237B1881|nr:hypothetical protein [Streptomyces sp. ZAF1911]MDD9380363.1 hypothetical protein [Streptomyces sp. ZAF1911]